MFSDTTFHVDHEFHIGFYSIHLVWPLDGLEKRDFSLDGYEKFEKFLYRNFSMKT